MAGSNNINADLYTRYRALIGRIDQAVGRAVPRIHRHRDVEANAPVEIAEPWRNASVSLADQVTRKLIETQADAMEESEDDDSAVDETGDDSDDTDMGDTDPAAPTKPSEPTEPTKPSEPTEPTEPTAPTTPSKPDQDMTDPGPVDMPPAPVVGSDGGTPPMPTDPVVDPTPVDPNPVAPPTLPTSPVIPTEPVDVTPPPSAPAPVIPAAAAALNMLFHAQAVATDPVLQYKRALFRTLDSDSDGMVSTQEIADAMTAAGGDKWSAAALNGALDPSDSGQVSEEQFMQRLPTASFDYYDPMSSEPFYNPHTAGGAVGILENNIDVAATLERQKADGPDRTESALTPFDFNRNGSVELHELMVAVQAGGGSSQSARMLFNQLDPEQTGAVTSDQFNANLPLPTYDMTTGDFDYANQTVGQGISGLFFSMIWSQQPEARVSRSLFYGLDADGDGMVSADDLSRAVAEAGGSDEEASALRAQLDPNDTGAISMEQFIDNLPPVVIGANGVAQAAVIEPPAPPAVMVWESQETAPVPLPQNLSSSMMSVLLQAQNEEAWRGLI